MTPHPLYYLAPLTLLLAGCTIFGLPVADPALAQRPADFALVYQWREGSLPPPYHYEYDIELQPSGLGEIRMRPDYPADGVPLWIESFSLSDSQLDSLYQVFVTQGALTT
ncbi:MAG TPA: hypothetical protein PKA05_13295, partial [Roseiflexaceae bacterium]|nr:hypothetical protein [Roseiflexaceae bacterium]